jgi:transcriptional regulator with XRE-family HTH domain
MDAKQRLARRLRAVRLARGHTQEAVARALGLHRPAISEIEAGRRSVTSAEVAELSRLFQVPVSDLLSATPVPRPVSPVGIREVILRMVEVIANRFHPQSVILFGSHARGTADADSDVDLLVVMDVADSRRRTGARIGAALHDFQVPKDIVVTTPDAFQRRRAVPGTIERSAALEGEVLHGAG